MGDFALAWVKLLTTGIGTGSLMAGGIWRLSVCTAVVLSPDPDTIDVIEASAALFCFCSTACVDSCV
jgi:hypothetical protein